MTNVRSFYYSTFGLKEEEKSTRQGEGDRRVTKAGARDTEERTFLYPKSSFKQLIKKTCNIQDLNFSCSMFNIQPIND